MVPEKLVSQWESAYRRYGEAAEAATLARRGDSEAGRSMAAASLEVAAAWRQIAGVHGLPWWVLAAIDAAAEAFEVQAREWDERASRTALDVPRWPGGR